MKIKLITLLSGPAGTHQPGVELDTDSGDISKKEARELVGGGYAVELKSGRGETARMKAPENAMLTTSAEDDSRANLARIAEAQAAAEAQTAAESQAAAEAQTEAEAQAEIDAIVGYKGVGAA